MGVGVDQNSKKQDDKEMIDAHDRQDLFDGKDQKKGVPLTRPPDNSFGIDQFTTITRYFEFDQKAL